MTTINELGSSRLAVEAFERDAALSHLIRTTGDLEIVSELVHGPMGQSGVIEAVLGQRNQLALVAEKEGLPLDSYRLDLKALGATEEQLERVAANRVKRAALVETIGLEPNTRDVLSHSAQMRAAGHDVGGEGYGAHRKLVGGVTPRPATESVGRVNETGNGAALRQ